jgi:hypothetical protein
LLGEATALRFTVTDSVNGQKITAQAVIQGAGDVDEMTEL